VGECVDIFQPNEDLFFKIKENCIEKLYYSDFRYNICSVIGKTKKGKIQRKRLISNEKSLEYNGRNIFPLVGSFRYLSPFFHCCICIYTNIMSSYQSVLICYSLEFPLLGEDLVEFHQLTKAQGIYWGKSYC
jgi:hypothetical protein